MCLFENDIQESESAGRHVDLKHTEYISIKDS